MARKRQTYQLTLPDTTWQRSIDFEPNTVSIFNPTKYTVYVFMGTVARPSSKAFSAIVPAVSNFVDDPAGATEFALFVDLAGDPFPFFPMPITITFSTGSAAVTSPLASAYAGAAATINGQYDAKIMQIQAGFHIDYWRLNDLVGSIAVDLVDAARNGAYDADVTLNAGLWTPGGASDPCPSWNGTSSDLNLLTSSLQSFFNGNKGTIALWFRMLDPAVWSDATVRTLARFRIDATNYIQLVKTTIANQFQFVRLGASINKTVTHTFTGAPTTWQFVAFTWDNVADQVRAYVNGAQSGSTLTAIGTMSGALSSAAVGSDPNASWWKGLISRASLWQVALTPTEVGQISAVP